MFSIMLVACLDTQHKDTKRNAIQHNDIFDIIFSKMTLSLMTLSIMMLSIMKLVMRTKLRLELTLE
jgi:hypothetical protein